MTVTVYRYALRTRADGPYIDPADPAKGRRTARYELPKQVTDQLYLSHQMRNARTEIALRAEEARKAIWSAWPQVAQVEERLAVAQQAADQAAEQAKASRVAGRTVATHPQAAAALREANRVVRELRQQRRDAIEAAYPSAKPQLEALKAQEKAQEKALRQEFAARGLYWATYNRVLSDHAVTVKLVEQRRRAHLPAGYRFRRWDGSGTIGLQLQRSNGRAVVVALRVRPRDPAADLSTVKVPVTVQGTPPGRVAVTARLVPADPSPDGDDTGEPADPSPDGDDTGEWTCEIAARNLTDAPAAVTLSADVSELLEAADVTGATMPVGAAPEAAGSALDAAAGTLTWTGQLPGGDPYRSPQVLAGAGRPSPWRNVLTLAPWHDPAQWESMSRSERSRLARQGKAVIAAGGGAVVELPVIVHRMLPADADVVEASLTVERIAGQWTAALSITARVPDPAPAQGRPMVALHTGWRTRRDGSVRVATWTCAEPLAVPASLADAGRGQRVAVPYDDGRTGEIVVPAGWLDDAGYAPAVRGTRDTSLDAMRKQLAAALRESPSLAESATGVLRKAAFARLAPRIGHEQARVTAEKIEVTAQAVERWKSPNRFANLALAWRQSPPAAQQDAEAAAALNAWAIQDRHLWEGEAHTRDQSGARRDNAWRNVAAWLAASASVLVVDDSDLRTLRRRPGADDDDPVLPGVAQQKARARAALAAPGRLREFAVKAAVREGLGVREVEAAYLSRTCPYCSHVSEAGPQFAAAAMVVCGGCGKGYDQDLSAARLMLERASTTAG